MSEDDAYEALTWRFVDSWASERNSEALGHLDEMFESIALEVESPRKQERFRMAQIYKVKLYGQLGRDHEARTMLLSLIDQNCPISLEMGASIAVGDLKDYQLGLNWAIKAERRLNCEPECVDEEVFEEHLQQVWWIQAKALDSLSAPESDFATFWSNIENAPELIVSNHTSELLEKWSKEGKFQAQVQETRDLLGTD